MAVDAFFIYAPYAIHISFAINAYQLLFPSQSKDLKFGIIEQSKNEASRWIIRKFGALNNRIWCMLVARVSQIKKKKGEDQVAAPV